MCYCKDHPACNMENGLEENQGEMLRCCSAAFTAAMQRLMVA